MRINILASVYAPELTRVLCADGHEVSVWWKKGDKDISNPEMYNPYIVRNELSKAEFLALPCDVLVSNYSEPIYTRQSISPSNFSRKLENNREFGKEMAKQCGLSVPHVSVFTNKDVAISSLGKNRVVLKQYDTHVTFNREQAKSLIAKMKIDKSKPLLIEPYIEGVELAFGWWVQPTLEPETVMVNKEYKGSVDGNKGNILTGESGTAWTYRNINSLPKTIREAILALNKRLQISGHVGFFDINTIHDNGKFHFLEFTSRMGYPTEQLHAHALHYAPSSGYGEFLYALQHDKPLKLERKFDPNYRFVAVGLYPIGLGAPNFKGVGEQQIFGYVENIHYVDFDVRQKTIDGETTYWAGGSDRACFAIACKKYAKEASAKATWLASKLQCYSHMYRTDIGQDFDEVLKCL